MYSLAIDDLVSQGVARYEIRAKLDEILERPLDALEAEEYDRENWGLGADAVLAAQQKDTMWGSLTHGEEVVA